MKGIYKYTDLKTGDVVYVGKDSHIDKNSRRYDHSAPSNYNNKARGLKWLKIEMEENHELL